MRRSSPRFDRYLVAYKTIVVKEVTRFVRIWIQTILPTGVSMSLYFIIFGQLIGPRIGEIAGYRYIQYIAPGLIMMSVITNAYANVVSSFFGSKFQRNIEEMLVAPIPSAIILAGFVTGGMVRGLLVGTVVTAVALLFTELTAHSYGVMVATIVLTSVLFSLGGFINGIFARNFDDTSIIPTFVLTPLIYLGGVFYSIELLPPVWRSVSLANPVLYMVDAFRYGILGVSDVSIALAFAVIVGCIAILWCWSLYLLNRGVGIRN
ncbi:MAG: ABC transporter permease [Beggiatoa sp.]|nr:ABC transporter permease [Beggiatoa sp.]